MPTVMAAIVIVIISNGNFIIPIIPNTNNAEIRLGTIPININAIDLNKIRNIEAIISMTKPSDII